MLYTRPTLSFYIVDLATNLYDGGKKEVNKFHYDELKYCENYRHC